MTAREELPERDLFGARPGEYMLPVSVHITACASCGAMITFIRTKAGAQMPLALSTTEERDGDRYALPHFFDCPQSKEWSKKR